MGSQYQRAARATIAAALLATFGTSCWESTPPPSLPLVPFPMTGTWAGETWTGKAEAALYFETGKPTVLRIWGTGGPLGTGVPDDVAYAAADFTGTGQYSLDSTRASYAVILGGDVELESYVGTGVPAGALIVTAIDSVAQTIEGALSFSTKSGLTNPSFGTRPTFSGAFKAKYRIYRR